MNHQDLKNGNAHVKNVKKCVSAHVLVQSQI